MMRKYGQEIIKATAGKKIHGTGAIPGGVNKNLSIAERDGFLKDLDQMLDLGARRAEDRQGLHASRNLEKLAPFGSFDSNHLSLVRDDGAMDLYDGEPAGDRRRRQEDLRPGRLPEVRRLHRRGGPAVVVHEVPVHQVARAGERLVPRRAAGAHQHGGLHRHARGRGRAQGVHGGRPTASPTTSRWPTTGRA